MKGRFAVAIVYSKNNSTTTSFKLRLSVIEAISREEAFGLCVKNNNSDLGLVDHVIFCHSTTPNIAGGVYKKIKKRVIKVKLKEK